MIRYAIYFMPPTDGALWQFGSSILGYDAETDTLVGPPATDFFTVKFSPAYVSEPQKYGFHATLKAPFALFDNRTEQQLCDAAAAFAQARTAVATAPPRIAAIGPFLALVPSDELADDCVREFDLFRAPASPAERARRLTAVLTQKQAELLDRWGYSYVFDEFQFYMTLSSRLQLPDQKRFRLALEAVYAPVAAPIALDSIAISKQIGPDARLRVLSQFTFGGQS